jgi:hypothetical protein
MTAQTVVAKMAYGQDNATYNGGQLFSRLPNQVMPRVGNQDQRKQAETSEKQNNPVLVTSATNEQRDKTDGQNKYHHETMKFFVSHDG